MGKIYTAAQTGAAVDGTDYTSHGVTHQNMKSSTYGNIRICVYHVYYGKQNNPDSDTNLRKVRALLRSKPMK